MWAYRAPDEHLGFGMRRWRHSDLLHYINRLPTDAVIYTNSPTLVRLRTGRLVAELPVRIDADTLAPLPDVAGRLEYIERHLRAHDGYVVHFDTIDPARLVPESDLRRALDLRLGYVGRDGNVYQVTEPATPAASTEPASKP